jgi:hypothetical protein
MESRAASERWIAALLVAAGSGLLIAGALAFDLFEQVRGRRAAELLGLAAVLLALAALLRRVLHVPPAVAAALGAVLLYVPSLGLAQVAAVLLLALAGLALGSTLVPRDTPAGPWLALLVGLGLLAGVIGWLLPLRVHFAAHYVLIASVLLLRRRVRVFELLGDVVASARRDDGAGWVGAFGVVVVAAIGSSTWLPTAQFDDIVYHLGLPWQLAELGHYRMDPASQVWALAPWSGDVLHAAAQLLAGTEARGALNALYLVTAGVLLYTLARQAGLSAPAGWLTLALALSQPVTLVLGAGMQTELAATAVLLALAVRVQSSGRAPPARLICSVAVLCAFAIGLKTSTLLYVLPLAVWFLWRARGLSPVSVLAAAALAIVVGASSYAYAALIAGNPVLPLLNDVFQSPYFELRRFQDARYAGLIDWSVWWRLVTDSSTFYESWDGVSGFQWLVLAGPLFLALRSPPLRPLLLAGLVGVLVVFSQVQYLRYLYPGLVLLCVPLVGGAVRGLGERWAALLVIALAVLNLAFAANAHWQLRESARGRPLVSERSEQEWLARFAPERVVARHLRARYGDAYRLLLPQPDYSPGAEFAGRAYVVSWYDTALAAQGAVAAADASGAAWARLARELGATHALIEPHHASTAVLELVRQHGTLELSVGTAELYRLAHPPLVPLAAPQRHGDALLVEFAPPQTPSLLIDARFVARCRAGTTVAAVWSIDAQPGEPVHIEYLRCDPGGRARFATTWSLERPARRLVLRVEAGADPVELGVDELAVVALRDLATERDVSGRWR